MEGVLGVTPCHHDVKTSWDIDRSSAFVCDPGESRESTQATPEKIGVAFVQKRCNLQMGSLPDWHR
jgi:hypothetical protein